MVYKMRLFERPFEDIKSGVKTVEFRLLDEKRQQIKIGDIIEFTKLPNMDEKLKVEVLDLYKEPNFEALFRRVYQDENDINNLLEAIYKIYTKEEEKKYGALGIKIKLLDE